MNIDRNIEENYETEKITINLVWANIFGIIVLVAAFVLFSIAFYFLWPDKVMGSFVIISNLDNGFFINAILFLVIFIISIFIHELIHGIFFAIYSDNKFKSIKFGVLPKEKLYTPYCHCKEILKINHYRIAALMPLIVMGVIPAGISLIVGNYSLLIYGILFICAGCGDLLMVLKMIKEKNNVLIYDLPDDAGFIVYRPKEK